MIPADAQAQVTADQELAAEAELIALTAPLAARTSPASHWGQLTTAALLTAYAAGLRLLASPGIGRAVGGACAAMLVLWLLNQAGQFSARHGHPAAQPSAEPAPEPSWVAAAAIHRLSLTGRIDPATLAAADRNLPALGQGRLSAHLYVHRCAGPGRHTRLCQSVGTWEPDGRLLLIVGEHPAAQPTVAMVSMAHELRHLSGWTDHAFSFAATTRAGWGWVAAGSAWALTGCSWPFLFAATARFHLLSLMTLWVIECACDVSAARAHGRAATLKALTLFAAQRTAHHDHSPRRTARHALGLLAGPSHPAPAVRQAVIRTLIRSRP